jgi:hypothetical protein
MAGAVALLDVGQVIGSAVGLSASVAVVILAFVAGTTIGSISILRKRR